MGKSQLSRRGHLLILAALALLTALALLPAANPAAANGDLARVRAVHAIPDLGPVDVYVGADKALSDVPFFTVSDYLELAAGNYRVRIVAAGGALGSAVIDENVTVASGGFYSIVARGVSASHAIGATVLEDDNAAPEAGNARIRVAHFSPGAPNVDIFIDGARTITNLAFQSVSSYLSVPAGSYEVGVAPTGGSPIYTASLTVEAGKVYTAWANGLLGTSVPAGQAFKVTPSVDASFEFARVRAVHAVPDLAGSPVDVYANGAKIATFDFFDVTDYLTVTTGDYDIRVVPAGGDPATDAAIQANVTVAAGKDYSIIARGTGGSFGATVLEDDNSRPAAAEARIRAAHFSPGAPTVDIFIDGTRTITNLAYLGASSYLSVPAGSYMVGVAPTGGSPIYTASLTVEAGKVYTAWANGLLGTSVPANQAFKVTPTVDASFDVARVRAVHAVPDLAGSPVDVYANGAKIATFDFFDVTDYIPVYAGDYDIRVVPAGGDPATDAAIQANVPVMAGKDYSIIARGTGGSFGATVLEDDNSRPAAGSARIRAAHFSPDAPAVDIFIDGTRTITNLAFLGASSYLSVPAGSYAVGVAPAGGSPIYTASLTVEAGKVYTAWANGLLAGAGAQAFKVTPTVDASYEATRLRLLHAVPDAPAVDVYLDDEKVAEGVSFGDLSGYLPVEPGTYNVKITAAGATTAVISGSVTLEEGKAYTAAAAGLLSGSAELKVFEDNAMPAFGKGSLRAVHLSPDAPAVDVLSGGTALISGLSFGESQALELDAGTYSYAVAVAGGGTTVLSGTVTIPVGSATTIYVIGLATPATPDQELRAIVAVDAIGGTPTVVTTIYMPIIAYR